MVEIEIDDALKGTQRILSQLEKRDLKDKIVLLKVYGTINQGKTSDIKFQEIEEYLERVGVYSLLKNTSKLEVEKKEMEIQLQPHEMEKVEEVLIKKYEQENPSSLNELILPLIEALNLEKQEDEKQVSFETRLFSGLSKILGIEII